MTLHIVVIRGKICEINSYCKASDVSLWLSTNLHETEESKIPVDGIYYDVHSTYVTPFLSTLGEGAYDSRKLQTDIVLVKNSIRILEKLLCIAKEKLKILESHACEYADLKIKCTANNSSDLASKVDRCQVNCTPLSCPVSFSENILPDSAAVDSMGRSRLLDIEDKGSLENSDHSSLDIDKEDYSTCAESL